MDLLQLYRQGVDAREGPGGSAIESAKGAKGASTAHALNGTLVEPTDWKPFDDVGAGTKEIRIRDASGIYRVMCVAKFEEAIYVLHCFQKKTQVTSKQDGYCRDAQFAMGQSPERTSSWNWVLRRTRPSVCRLHPANRSMTRAC